VTTSESSPPGATRRSLRRCPWADSDPLLAEYHDHERGRFPGTESGLFEAFSLDVLKGGLPWREVLAHREGFRVAFAGFEPEVVARFDEAEVGRIGRAVGLANHRGRIRAVTQNARRLVTARAEWGSAPDDRAAFGSWLASTAPEAVVAELAERFRMVSHGVARSFVESVGLVPLGHAPDCWRARGVVFDLDGVILDSEVWWREVREGLLRDHGGEWTEDDHRAIMGMSSREWAAEMVRRKGLGGDPAVVEAEVVARLVSLYRLRRPPLIEGAVDAVRAVAARHPVALASSAHPAVISVALASVGLERTFEGVVSSDDVARGKPSADVYVAAARKLALRPSSCVAVEDSISGLRSALAAGMAAALVPNPSIPPPREAYELATAVVPRLTDLDADAILDAHHAVGTDPQAHDQGATGSTIAVA